MRKAARNAVIKLGARDRWHDISTPKIWAKRIDSDTDSRFWISFSASEMKAREVTKFVADQITRARKERLVFERGQAGRYKAARLERRLTIARIDAALTQMMDELDALEGSAAAADSAPGDKDSSSRGALSEWLAQAPATGVRPLLPMLPGVPRKPRLVSLTSQGKIFGRPEGAKNERTLRLRRAAETAYRAVARMGSGFSYPSHASRCREVQKRLTRDGHSISDKRLQTILRPLYRKPGKKPRQTTRPRG